MPCCSRLRARPRLQGRILAPAGLRRRLPSAPGLYFPFYHDELPEYVAGWDVAILPFARNESTRFISPTKTPEYLAAGRPVVSTSIRDVVRPYGEVGLARIADDPEVFARALDEAMAEDRERRIERSDALLARTSWDRTWQQMRALIDTALHVKANARTRSAPMVRASATEAGHY